MGKQKRTSISFDFGDVERLIIAVQEDPSDEVRSLALRALVRLPLQPPVWFELASLLSRAFASAEVKGLAFDTRVEVAGLPVSELIEAAAYVPVKRVRQQLRDLLGAEDAEVSTAAAHALAKARDSAAVPKLLLELERNDVGRRYTAARDLYFLDLSGSRAALQQSFQKESAGGVKLWLALALGRQGTTKPIESVLTALSSGEIDLDLLRWHGDELFGLGPFPEKMTKILRRIATNQKLSSHAREVAEDLLLDPAAKPGTAAAEPLATAEMTREADELAESLQQQFPSSMEGTLMYEAGEKLQHMTPAKLPELVTRLFEHVSEGEFSGMGSTLFGNFIMEVIRPLRADFKPEVVPLFETFCSIRKKYHDVSMQLAWTVSRGELQTVVPELIKRAGDKDAGNRAAAMELVTLSLQYLHQDYPPLFGGGSDPSDVPPDTTLLLDSPPDTLFYAPAPPLKSVLRNQHELSFPELGRVTRMKEAARHDSRAKPPERVAAAMPTAAEALPAAAESAPSVAVESSGPQPLEPVPVLLGAAAPPNGRPGDHFVAVFAAYVKQQEENVRAEFARRSRRSEAQLDLESCHWALNTKVQVVVTGEHMTADPQLQEFVWQGGRNVLGFEVAISAAAPAGSTVLKFSVYIAETRVALLPLEIEIGAAPATAEQKEVNALPARKAFASYASADRPRVLDRVRSLEISGGLDVFQDCLDMHPGDKWKPVLEKEIRDREIFILFWSKHAKDSPWVTWEWKLALAGSGKPHMEMQPLEPFAEVGAPPELEALHMDDSAMILRKYYEDLQNRESPD